MATNTDDKNVYLTTDASTYAIGDTVKVTAYLYSETYQPQTGATVQIEVVPPDGNPFQLQMALGHQSSETVGQEQLAAKDTSLPRATNTDGNLYTAQFLLLKKGQYRIRATGRSGNLILGEDEINIYAHPQACRIGISAAQ